MSKKKLFTVAASAAVLSTAVVPFAVQAEENYTKAPMGVYVTAPEGEANIYYSLSQIVEDPTLVVKALIKYKAENVHFVVAGKYASAKQITETAVNQGDASLAYSAQSAENDVPGGTYAKTDGTKLDVVGGDPTPEENSIETFFYNFAA